MRPSLLATLALVTLVAGAGTAAEPPPGSEPIAIVVGRESMVANVSQDALRELYLRRQRVWPGGAPAIPINFPAGNPLREVFSKLVLGRSSSDLVAYWNGRYFEGIRPPIVLPSAAAIRAYLAAEPGAIAYLPATEVDDSMRVLLKLPGK